MLISDDRAPGGADRSAWITCCRGRVRCGTRARVFGWCLKSTPCVG